MEELKQSATNLADQAVNYASTFYDHMKVTTAIKTTNVVSGSLMIILVTCFILFCLLFAGIGTGLWLGHVMNNMQSGFFIVAGIYLLLAFLLFLQRKSILTPLKNFIVKKIYE